MHCTRIIPFLGEMQHFHFGKASFMQSQLALSLALDFSAQTHSTPSEQVCLKVSSPLQAGYYTLEPCLLALLHKQETKQTCEFLKSELLQDLRPLVYK